VITLIVLIVVHVDHLWTKAEPSVRDPTKSTGTAGIDPHGDKGQLPPRTDDADAGDTASQQLGSLRKTTYPENAVSYSIATPSQKAILHRLREDSGEFRALKASLQPQDIGYRAGNTLNEGVQRKVGGDVKELAIKAAWRVENRELMEKYDEKWREISARRKDISPMQSLTSKWLKEIGTNTSWPERLMRDAGSPLPSIEQNSIDKGLNELYAFHGSEPEFIISMLETPPRKGGAKTLTRGIYLTEDTPAAAYIIIN